MKFVFAVNNF